MSKSRDRRRRAERRARRQPALRAWAEALLGSLPLTDWQRRALLDPPRLAERTYSWRGRGG